MFPLVYDQFHGGELLKNKYVMQFGGLNVEFSEEKGKWRFSIEGKPPSGEFDFAYQAEAEAYNVCKLITAFSS
jgi:hypothetical protein